MTPESEADAARHAAKMARKKAIVNGLVTW